MGHCSVGTQVHFVDTKLKLAPPQLQLQTANYLHSLKMFHLSQLPFFPAEQVLSLLVLWEYFLEPPAVECSVLVPHSAGSITVGVTQL